MFPKLKYPMLVSFSVFILIFGLTLSMTAQTIHPTPTREPVEEGTPLAPSADLLAEREAEIAAWEAQFNARTIFDFRTAYLIAEGAVEAQSLISPRHFESIMGAEPITSWETLITQHEIEPFQIVLIHPSLLDEVDFSWTQAAFRQQVLIVGVDLSFTQLTQVTGDQCMQDPTPGLSNYFDHIIQYITFNVRLEDESHRAQVTRQMLETCETVTTENSTVYLQHSVITLPMTSIERLEHFAEAVLIDTVNYGLTPLP
jgi:hypothetical protein